MMNLAVKMGNVQKGLTRHVVASLAQLLPTYPILSLTDTHIAHMPADQSIKSRAIATVVTLTGGGLVYDMIRKGSLEFFNIEKEKHAGVRTGIHDALYNAVVYTLGTMPMYMASGVDTVKQLALTAAGTATLGFFSGPIIGLTTDVLKDWSGVEPCSHLPSLIRDRSENQKKGLVGLLVGGSIGLAGVNYHYASNQHPERTSPYQISTVGIE